MYKLMVYHPGGALARTTIPVARAADVLTRITQVLAEHDGCESVVVTFNDVRLFAVDCAGNRLP